MNRYARPENFGHHIRTPLLRKHFVYRAFDANGQLLYIGCTHDVAARLKEHKTLADWRDQAVRVTTAGPYNYETARQIEYDAIESERSLYNYSTERRELHRLHQTLVKQRMARASMDDGWERALHEAVDYADAALPEGRGRRPVLITDQLMADARELVRRDAEQVAA